MPWVRLDDRFPSHRKVSLLSDRAFRLYVSALCWASENLTEGKILDRELSVVARIRGIKSVAAELEAAGLWDRIESGWVIHDYLEYNPDRARVQADREANAARQQAWRDRKRAEREAKRAAEETKRNGVTRVTSERSNDTTATRTRLDIDMDTRNDNFANPSSSQVSEIRNAVSNGTPSRPVPVSPNGDTGEEKSQPARVAHIGDRPRIPDASQPLVDKLTAAGMVVGWDLSTNDWFLLEALIKKCGVDHLVVTAADMWANAKKRPRYGSYFIPGWRALPAIPEGTPVAPNSDNLPALPGANVVALRGGDANLAAHAAVIAQLKATEQNR